MQCYPICFSSEDSVSVHPEERNKVCGVGPSARKSPSAWDSDHELSSKGKIQRGAEMITQSRDDDWEVQLELLPHDVVVQLIPGLLERVPRESQFLGLSSWSCFLTELDYRGWRSSWSQFLMELDYRGWRSSWSQFLMELDYRGWRSSWSQFLMELDYRRWRSSWSQFLMELDYRGWRSSWSQFLMELDHHGWRSSWSQFLTELDYRGWRSSWSQFLTELDYRGPYRDEDQSWEDRNHHSYRGSDLDRHSRERTSGSNSRGSSVDLVPCGTEVSSDSCSAGASFSGSWPSTDCQAGVGSSQYGVTVEGGPAGVCTSQYWTTVDRGHQWFHLQWFHTGLQSLWSCITGSMIWPLITMSRCYCQGCGWLNQFNGKWCPSGISFWCWGQFLWLPLASIGNRPTDSQLHLKWQTLKTCFLLALAMALSRSFIYTLSVAPGHFTFKVLWMANLQWLCFLGRVLGQESAVSQVPGWVTIPGISHLIPDDSERTLCSVHQLYLCERYQAVLWGAYVSLSTFDPCLPWYLPEPHLQVDCQGDWSGLPAEWSEDSSKNHCTWTERFGIFIGIYMLVGVRRCDVGSILAICRSLPEKLSARSHSLLDDSHVGSSSCSSTALRTVVLHLTSVSM